MMQECKSSAISPTAIVLFSIAFLLSIFLAKFVSRERAREREKEKEREKTRDAKLTSRLNRLEDVTTDLLHMVSLLQPTSEMQDLDVILATDTATEKHKPSGSREAASQTKQLKKRAVCNCSGETVNRKLDLTPQIAANCYADSTCRYFASSPSKLRVDETLRIRHTVSGATPSAFSRPIVSNFQDQDWGFARTSSAGPPQGYSRSQKDICDTSSSSPHRQSSSEEGRNVLSFKRAVSSGPLASISNSSSSLVGKQPQPRPSQRLQGGNLAARAQGSDSSISLCSSIQQVHSIMQCDERQQAATSNGNLHAPSDLFRSERFDKQFRSNEPIRTGRTSSGTIPRSCSSPTDSRHQRPSHKYSSTQKLGITRTNSLEPSQGAFSMSSLSPIDSGFTRTTSAGPPQGHKKGSVPRSFSNRPSSHPSPSFPMSSNPMGSKQLQRRHSRSIEPLDTSQY